MNHRKADRQRGSLFHVIRVSFMLNVLGPFFLIAVLFLGTFYLSTNLIRTRMTQNMTRQVNVELSNLSEVEARTAEQQLTEVGNLTKMFAAEMKAALATDAVMDPEDQARLAYSDLGPYYTTSDRSDGGAAVFYSGCVPIGVAERAKVARALTAQRLMKSIHLSHPLAVSLYLNTFDSLNVIYPYFNVISQYTPKMDIPTYNFYYEADAAHNPDRGVQWTVVYLDPAGHGWIASAIAPVYDGDFLEGVVGIDVTVSAITENVLNISIPWDGYGLLVGEDGGILALPVAGEGDWGLKELTDHHYDQAIMSDTFKPDDFNLNSMPDQADLAARMKGTHNGFTTITLKGKRFAASWHTIENTGWKLLLMAPESTLYAQVSQLVDQQMRIAYMTAFSLFVFLTLLFFYLAWQARRMSSQYASPLIKLNAIIESIGCGNFVQEDPAFKILELEHTASSILSMGKQLQNANLILLSTQKDLEDRESNLRAVVNAMDDIVIETNLEGEVIHTWTRDRSLLPIRLVQSPMPNVKDYLQADQAKEMERLVVALLETELSQTAEYQSKTPSGSRWFLVRIHLTDQARKTLVFSSRDITDRKEMEHSLMVAKEEAEKANRAKTDFLSSMSHELRTPLNAVLGFSQLLQMDGGSPLSAEQAECVSEITKAGKHLLDLINEVLDLAKIETGKLTISLEPVQLFGVMDQVLTLMKPLAEQRGIEIGRCASDCAFDYMKADALRIKQVLINLISNAIKYNREHGKVLISCAREDKFIKIRIADTGLGIPREYLNAIFEPFHRLSATKNTVEGTGIGLVVVKRLMALMGGEICVESEEGVGSAFTLSIPVADRVGDIPDAHISALAACAVPSTPGSVKKVLYIEDNPANLTLVERIVSHMPGLQLIVANQGSVGVDLAKAHHPALALIDINLPDIDGFEVLRRLKQDGSLSGTTMVAVSANAMKKDIDKGLSWGFDDYITKPIDVVRFIGLVQRYTGMLGTPDLQTFIVWANLR